MRDRHAAWCLALARAAAAAAERHSVDTPARRRLRAERENVRAALAWCASTPDGRAHRPAAARRRRTDVRRRDAERGPPLAGDLPGAGARAHRGARPLPARPRHQPPLAPRVRPRRRRGARGARDLRGVGRRRRRRPRRRHGGPGRRQPRRLRPRRRAHRPRPGAGARARRPGTCRAVLARCGTDRRRPTGLHRGPRAARGEPRAGRAPRGRHARRPGPPAPGGPRPPGGRLPPRPRAARGPPPERRPPRRAGRGSGRDAGSGAEPADGPAAARARLHRPGRGALRRGAHAYPRRAAVASTGAARGPSCSRPRAWPACWRSPAARPRGA